MIIESIVSAIMLIVAIGLICVLPLLVIGIVMMTVLGSISSAVKGK